MQSLWVLRTAKATMKKLFLAGVAALSVLGASAAHAADQPTDEVDAPPARVTVAPPYQGPPPMGWVYSH